MGEHDAPAERPRRHEFSTAWEIDDDVIDLTDGEVDADAAAAEAPAEQRPASPARPDDRFAVPWAVPGD